MMPGEGREPPDPDRARAHDHGRSTQRPPPPLSSGSITRRGARLAQLVGGLVQVGLAAQDQRLAGAAESSDAGGGRAGRTWSLTMLADHVWWW